MYKRFLLFSFLFMHIVAWSQIPYVDSKEVLEKGRAFYDKGAYRESIAEYSKINESDTNYSVALYEQVLSLVADSSYDTAIVLAKYGLCLRTSDKRQLQLILGAAYDYSGHSDSAIALYESLTKLYPNDHQPWYEMGIISFRKKQYDNALYYLRRSLLINPNHFSSHYMTGLIYAVQGRLSEAFIALESSLLMTDNATNAKKSISVLDGLTEETDEVVKLYHEKKEQYSHPLFDDIDQIVNSKVALSSDYKLKISLNDNIFRQSQVIMEKLKYDPNDTNFVMQYYVPMLVDVYKNDLVEPLLLLKYSGYGFENVDALAKKKSKEVDDVKKIVFPYFTKIQNTRELNFVKRQKAASHYHYYPKENLIIIGDAITNGSNDLAVGDVELFRNNHTLRGKGRYDNLGKQDGWWTYYYSTGELKSKEHYAHGNLIDTAFTYYDNGNLQNVTVRDRTGAAKVEYEYHEKGWLSEKRQQLADKIVQHWSYYPNGQLEYVEKYDDKKELDGKYTVFFANGKVKKEQTEKDGKVDGLYKTWYDNGQLGEEAHYDNGKLEGPDVEYYESGKLKERSTFKKGKIDGEDEKYDEDGHLTRKNLYNTGDLYEVDEFTPAGRLYGIIKLTDNVPYYIRYLNDDSVVAFEQENKKGIFEYKLCFANGNAATQLKINSRGVRHGLEFFYYETGNKSEETNYNDGQLEGSSVTYYKCGKTKEEDNYKENQRDGYYKSFYANGNVKSEGWYKKGKRQGQWMFYYVNGKPQNGAYYLNDKLGGAYREYNINGELTNKYMYDNGELMAHTCYDTAGRKTDSTWYDPTEGYYKVSHWSLQPRINDLEYGLKYGNMHGQYVRRYVTGAFTEKSHYKDGKRDSICYEYFPDGKVRLNGAYRRGDKVGTWQYFNEAGEKWREENFNSFGNLDGNTTMYACNTARAQFHYKNGNRDSAQVYFGEDGKIAFITYFDNGKFTGYTYTGNDGRLRPQTKAKNGAGSFTAYYPNGQKSGEVSLEQSLFKGRFAVYYSNGNLAEERYYNENFDLDGPVKKYSPAGKLVFQADYKDDEELGVERTFDKDGTLLVAANYYYGTLNGPTVVTDPATHSTSTYYYHFGRLTSVTK